MRVNRFMLCMYVCICFSLEERAVIQCLSRMLCKIHPLDYEKVRTYQPLCQHYPCLSLVLSL